MKNLVRFTQTAGSLLCSQEPVTRPVQKSLLSNRNLEPGAKTVSSICCRPTFSLCLLQVRGDFYNFPKSENQDVVILCGCLKGEYKLCLETKITVNN